MHKGLGNGHLGARENVDQQQRQQQQLRQKKTKQKHVRFSAKSIGAIPSDALTG